MEGPKSNVVAGVLAILLGWLGIQHFYLGNNKFGGIYLGCSLGGMIIGGVGSILCIPAILLLLPMAVGIASLVEGVLYLTMPPEKFEAKVASGETSVLNGLFS